MRTKQTPQITISLQSHGTTAPAYRSKSFMKAIGCTKEPPFPLSTLDLNRSYQSQTFSASQPLQTSELTEDSHSIQVNLSKVPLFKENILSTSLPESDLYLLSPLQSCVSHYPFLRAKCFHRTSQNIYLTRERRIITTMTVISQKYLISMATPQVHFFFCFQETKQRSKWRSTASHVACIRDLMRSRPPSKAHLLGCQTTEPIGSGLQKNTNGESSI